MKPLKKVIILLPEYFLIFSTIVYWLSAGWMINPIAIVFLLALGAQLYFKNKNAGIALSVIFSFIFCYLFLALFSDLIKLDNLSEGYTLLLYGSLYLGLSLCASVAIFFKYLHKSSEKKAIVA